MKTTINCFIPFANAAQAEKTVLSLQSSDLIKKIYLLTTETTATPLPGCDILTVSALNSSAATARIAMRTIPCFIPNIQHCHQVCSPSNV